MPKPSILLVDDSPDLLQALKAELEAVLNLEAIDIREWVPDPEQGSPEDYFQTLVDDQTVMVVTDYDLTTKMKGLFGVSIVSWCQARLIPVGDYSRRHDALPAEPNLFEFRVPSRAAEAARFIASTAGGFQDLKVRLTEPPEDQDQTGLAALLAAILGRPHLDSDLSLYLSRLASSNAAILQRLKELSDTHRVDAPARATVISYILGHVLLNSVLKYPGPILSDEALCAYFGCDIADADILMKLFEAAAYSGPFSEDGRYVWREDVDQAILDALSAGEPLTAESDAELFRLVAERMLGATLRNHGCPRCGGMLGGFLCPFTTHAVCLREDCSVAAVGWIPQGAQLSRIEKTYYEEWAPLLGF